MITPLLAGINTFKKAAITWVSTCRTDAQPPNAFRWGTSVANQTGKGIKRLGICYHQYIYAKRTAEGLFSPTGCAATTENVITEAINPIIARPRG